MTTQGMSIDILTIFPELFTVPLNTGILKKAQDLNLFRPRVINIRDFARDKHRTVDDYPYGGGGGMILKLEPIFEAIERLKNEAQAEKIFTILMTPQGKVYNQEKARELSRQKHLIVICGHYEGIDERVRMHLVDEEISIGDYILTGGEIPSLVIIESVVRLIPGVLSPEATAKESFSNNVLDFPQYTRPEVYRGMRVPEVLLSGNHQQIEKWRRKESLKRTYFRRPELLGKISLTDEELEFINTLKTDDR